MLGRDLRIARVKARPKVSQVELRNELRWDSWKISNAENEKVLLSPEDEQAYIAAVKAVSDRKRQQLQEAGA